MNIIVPILAITGLLICLYMSLYGMRIEFLMLNERFRKHYLDTMYPKVKEWCASENIALFLGVDEINCHGKSHPDSFGLLAYTLQKKPDTGEIVGIKDKKIFIKKTSKLSYEFFTLLHEIGHYLLLTEGKHEHTEDEADYKGIEMMLHNLTMYEAYMFKHEIEVYSKKSFTHWYGKEKLNIFSPTILRWYLQVMQATK